MTINDIKTPNDILEYLNENIEYGWIGTDGEKRIKVWMALDSFIEPCHLKVF